MRPYRAYLSLRSSPHTPRPLRRLSRPCLLLGPRASVSSPAPNSWQSRSKSDAYELPPRTHFEEKPSRFNRYDSQSETIDPDTRPVRPRNPLNYQESERIRYRNNQYYRRRMLVASLGLATCIVLQVIIIFTFGDEVQAPKDGTTIDKRGRMESLDARPGAPGGTGIPVVVREKLGMPEVKLDAEGNELVETATSSVPHFPKTIRLPASSAAPANTPIAPATPPQEKTEEYTLLGLGIRTVSFLRVQVYVLGIYVRTADLPTLQAAFVKQISPNATSLIPGEKAELRRRLLDPEDSRRIWDEVLRNARVRSAVRVVPTRGTGFSHLRDGWIRGLQNRTREAKEALVRESGASGLVTSEYEQDSFGNSVGEFKKLFNGKGNAPKGSVVMLTRDEKGRLDLSFKNTDPKSEGRGGESLGGVDDERVSRLLWLNYLGGKDVSSQAARTSAVNGVMELVERPVGTVGVGAA